MSSVERVRDSLVPSGRCPPGLDITPKENGRSGDPGHPETGRYKSVATKRKNYRRHPKPPYSYLALIAMVILNSPERKQTLSQILQAISRLSPFSTSEYHGWKDSVRHNLSANDCFIKVLKDPSNPRSKGNSWTVDPSRIPANALKCQRNLGLGRDRGTRSLEARSRGRAAGREGSSQIGNAGSLLPASLNGLVLNPPPLASSPSAASAEEPQRASPEPSSSSSGSGYESDTPRDRPHPPWELPASHTLYTPPNAMAPPSCGLPRPPVPGLARWPPCFLFPANPHPPPHYPPNPRLDLDAMLREVPPNKSVFDAPTPGTVPLPLTGSL